MSTEATGSTPASAGGPTTGALAQTGFAARYGPVAVVLGASEGLGAAFADALAARGLNLILVARRADALEAVAAPLRQQVEVTIHPLDLAAPDVSAQLQRLAERHTVGLVVHNAAFAPLGPFLQRPLDDALRALDVNARSLLAAAHAFGRPMAQRGRGGLVVMSSLTALTGSPGLATYGATKAFGRSFGEALWGELRAQGVDVSTCAAGATATPGFLRASGTDGPRAMTPRAVAEAALDGLGRGPGVVPGRLNQVAAFLLARLLPRRTTIGLFAKESARLKP